MKKHYLPLSLAVVTMLGAASVSAQTTRTWDGGGTTESFHEAANWSGDVVPTSIDNVTFNASSSKNCQMDADVQVANINVTSAYGGNLYLNGTNTLTANNITLNGAYFQLGVNTGASTAATVTISNNGWLNAASKNGFTATTLNVDPAGYFSAYYKATVNFNTINIDPYGQFKAPELGIVNLTAGFNKHKNSTYDHRLSTLVVNGSATQGFHLSTGAGQTDGSCDFWNIVLNKTNETTNGTDNMTVTAGDTVIAGNRMTIIDGDVASGSVGIADTLEHLGQGNQGHGANFYFTGAKNGDIILTGGNTLGNYDYVIVKATNTTPVYVWKGGATDVVVQANSIVTKGDLRFDDDVEANINGDVTVQDNGTLSMPAAEYFNLSADFNATAASTIAHRMGTLNYVGTGSRSFDFGARKEFYNIEFNSGATGGGLQPAGGNDTMVALNSLKLVSGYMSGGTGPAVMLVEGDLEVMSSISASNDWAYSIAFTGTGNSDYIAEVGVPYVTGNGAAGIVVNKATNTAKVTVKPGSASFATVGVNSNVYVRNGILEFPTKARINGNANPGLVVTGGTISAPATDTLFIRGAWNVYGPEAYTNNGGTTVLTGTSTDDFTNNNRAVKFYNLLINTNNIEWGASANSTTDTVWVEGDLTLANSGDLGNVSVVFEGDFTTIGSGSTPILDESAVAAGSGIQVISLGGTTHLQAEGLMINKTGGNVSLASNMTLDLLTLKNRNIIPGANTLTVAGPNNIIGGNAGSFIDGRLFITAASQWAGSRYLLPIGRGSSYRPVQLHNQSTTNNWNLEYVAGDTSSAGSLAGGLDAVSNTEYWRINRTGGGSGTFNANNATYIELSLNGKNGAWADADVRVASLSSGNWNNLGQLLVANNRVMSNGTVLSANGAGVFTLGLETPAPVRVVNGEQVSGQELSTTRNQAAVAAEAVNAAVSFQVFPNPVTETLNFAIKGSDKGIVTLSDLSGKVVGTFNVAEVRSISVSNLAAGVYFATFTDGVNRITQRVIRN